MRVDLGNGDWADIKDVSELRRPDRRAVNDTIVVEADASGRRILKASMDDDMTAEVLKRVVTGWSLQLPPPSQDPSSLDKLTLEQDDALSEAVEPHIAAIRGRDAPVKSNEVPTGASES